MPKPPKAGPSNPPNSLELLRQSQRAGPPLVLVHGFCGSAAAWHDVIQSLQPGFPVWAAQLPGHHPAVAAPASTATFMDVADGLAAELAACSFRDVHLVGYSLGARLSLAVALRHPAEVSLLTLIGVNPGLESDAGRAQRRIADAAWLHLLRTANIEDFVDAWAAQPLFATQAFAPVAAQQAQRQQRLGHNPRQLAALFDVTSLAEMPNFWPDLGGLQVATHYVAGADDSKFVRLARRASESTPGAHLHILAGCGHNPLLEVPQALAQLLCMAHAPLMTTPYMGT